MDKPVEPIHALHHRSSLDMRTAAAARWIWAPPPNPCNCSSGPSVETPGLLLLAVALLLGQIQVPRGGRAVPPLHARETLPPAPKRPRCLHPCEAAPLARAR
jgi:MYXO-CTERM domain-containing protein